MYAVEGVLSPQKRPHRLLVGGVHDGTGGAALFGALPGNGEAAEGVGVDRREGQRAAPQQIQRLLRRCRPLRPRHGVADGQLHIRRTQLGQHGPVPELHQRVDDALPVHHRVHLLQGKAVQPHGLDDLQPLVHQRGRVDGDLGAHAPVGVLQRMGRRHGLQFLIAPAEERAAGAGQDQAAYLPSVGAALQTLKNSGMLAVHRHDIRAVFLRGGHHQLSGAHQRLLVGQGDAPPKADGRQRRLQSYAAYHGGHHRVSLLRLCRRQKALRPRQHLDIRIAQTLPQLLRRGGVIKHRKARAELPRLRFYQLHTAVGRQRGHPQLQFPGHGQRLPPDGPGASQQGNGFCHDNFLNTGAPTG